MYMYVYVYMYIYICVCVLNKCRVWDTVRGYLVSWLKRLPFTLAYPLKIPDQTAIIAAAMFTDGIPLK